MAAVPLGVEAYSRAVAFEPETRLVNLYLEEDKSGASPDELMRLQRPGLTRLSTYPAAIRAIYQSDNPISKLPLIVAGDQWFAGPNVIATLTNDGNRARIEATSLVVACVSGGGVTLYNGTTSASLPLPNSEAAIDLCTLNGYVLVGVATGRFYWLVPGVTSIDALDYATAEAHPDGMIAMRVLRDEIFFFGSDSIEVWQATGDADATFKRADGRLIDRGIMARDTLVNIDNTFAWVGENGIVYRLGDVAERISTFGIEEKLKGRTADPSAWNFTSTGHSFYVLAIPGVGTYAYDVATKLWSEFATVGLTNWIPTVGADIAGMAVAGGAGGQYWQLAEGSSLDDGAPFQRLVTGTVALPARPIPNSSVAIGVGTSSSAAFSLRWYDPRRGWSEPRTLTARGEGDILNAWRLGLARAPSRTFEISTVTPAVVRISGAMANEGWRV